MSKSKIFDTPDQLKLTSTFSNVISLNQLINIKKPRKSVIFEHSERRVDSLAINIKKGDVSPLDEVNGDSSRVFGQQKVVDEFPQEANILN